MLGRSFSAPGTYNLPPGNMKSACVSTAHRTRSLGAMPVSACRLLDAASLYRESSNDKRCVWGASRRKAGKHEGHEGTPRKNRDSNYFVRFVSFVALRSFTRSFRSYLFRYTGRLLVRKSVGRRND